MLRHRNSIDGRDQHSRHAHSHLRHRAPAPPETPPGFAPRATAAAPLQAETPAGSDFLAADKPPTRHRTESPAHPHFASTTIQHREPQASASAHHTDSPDRSPPASASHSSPSAAKPSANATDPPLPASQTASPQDRQQNILAEPFRSPPAPSSRHRSQKTRPANSPHELSREIPRHSESKAATPSHDSTRSQIDPSQMQPHSMPNDPEPSEASSAATERQPVD